MRRPFGLVVLAVSMAVSPTAARQDTVIVIERGVRLDAGSRVAREAVDFFNDRAVTKVFGAFTVSTSEAVDGDVAVYGGAVRISGIIRGDLVVINGDLRLLPSGQVRGNILVVGGSVTGLQDARVDGNARIYSARVAARRENDRLELLPATRGARRDDERRRRRFPQTHASMVLSTGDTYNRVEGLPIHIGPRIEWRTFGRRHLFIEGLAIVRTAGDLENTQEDIGFTANAEWNIGGRSPVTIGGRGYNAVTPIEAWQLHSDEIGLATFFWHRDYRDYYFSRGFSGYLRVEPTGELSITGEVARNELTSAVVRDPWTPFRGDEAWRPNPQIDEGSYTIITSTIEWDSRPFRDARASGWMILAEWEHGRGDDVVAPILPESVRDPIPTASTYIYNRLFIDLRRYERIGWNGLLSLRALGAGNIGNQDPLPIQRRLSLGGPDPMPGFQFRQTACNETTADPARPALCDRILLFQVEYRGSLSFSRGSRRRGYRHRSEPWDDWWDWDEWFWDDGPTIVLFGNAGSGWIGNGGPEDFAFDVGAGIEFGSVGVYGAKALSEGEPFRVRLRIHRRF
ncbi:MAG: polymer-forming cytoskeletal protein [Gemmatimonadetes bacterium]|nr:polymer-forming cytoskeletal protein [Gemmatimonadota bacterium]